VWPGANSASTVRVVSPSSCASTSCFPTKRTNLHESVRLQGCPQHCSGMAGSAAGLHARHRCRADMHAGHRCRVNLESGHRCRAHVCTRHLVVHFQHEDHAGDVEMSILEPFVEHLTGCPTNVDSQLATASPSSHTHPFHSQTLPDRSFAPTGTFELPICSRSALEGMSSGTETLPASGKDRVKAMLSETLLPETPASSSD
jgi:hypothetical protein